MSLDGTIAFQNYLQENELGAELHRLYEPSRPRIDGQPGLTDIQHETLVTAFEIQQQGERIAQLDEYLGALGHLVVLREGDLAYLHVHPEETAPDSGSVRFNARFPTAGRYRLFLQAKPDGNLITTSFDVRLDDPNS